MKTKKVSTLLKKYYSDLESLTPEECAQLHQYANDQKKEMDKVGKVMTDLLLNTYPNEFPRIVNLRTATVVPGAERAPSGITWEEIQENKLPIPRDVFLAVAVVKISLLKDLYPAKFAKLEKEEWYQGSKTTSASYIQWSAPIRKIQK